MDYNTFSPSVLEMLHDPQFKYATAFGIVKGMLDGLQHCDWVPDREKEYMRKRIKAIEIEMEKGK